MFNQSSQAASKGVSHGSRPAGAEGASPTWAPISAASFSCFAELDDDFDSLDNSPSGQAKFGDKSLNKKDVSEKLEQELMDQKNREVEQFSARLSQLEGQFSGQFRDHEQVIAQRVLDLAVRLAEKVVRAHFVVNKSALLPLVEEALAQILPGDRNIKLSIHPDDAELVSNTFGDTKREGRITFVADESLAPGSCQIQSDYSIVDNSLIRRWEQMVFETGLNENQQSVPNFRFPTDQESENR